MSAAEHDALACEYVLGLLDGADAARAEGLAATDAGFAARVAAWRDRFAEFDATAPAQPAGAALWRRIEAGLDADPAVAQPPSAGRSVRLARLWHSLGFWRGAGLAAGAASLALAAALAAVLAARAPAPLFVAVLLTEDNRAAALVNAYADGRGDLVPIAPLDVPAGRVLQVWTLWDRARGPVSIGLAPAPHRLALGLDRLPRTIPNQLFEITLEPEGGSPTGRPSGPVLMKGLAARAL